MAGKTKTAAVSTASVLSDGKPEYRDGCCEHPETKVCPKSCPRVTGEK